MKITIVTPCSRPENLAVMAKSINIPRDKFRWIVVRDAIFDDDKQIFSEFPPEAEILYHQDPKSKFGNAQRNFALDRIRNPGEYVYFLDDDTVMHPCLYKALKERVNDFMHFDQCFNTGFHRIGGKVEQNHIDSGNVLIHRELIGETRWVLNRYGADGIFITECFNRANNPVYIHATLSIYNAIRP